MKKSELRKIIREELLNEGGVEDIIRYKPKSVNIKIPSFSIKAELRVHDHEKWEGSLIKEPVNVEISTFKHNIEKVMDDVVVKAIADAVNKNFKKLDFTVSDKNPSIGGHMMGFPNVINYNKK